MCDGTKEEGTKNVTETQTGKDGFISLLRLKGVEDFDQGMRIVSRNERRPFSSLSLSHYTKFDIFEILAKDLKLVQR